MLSRLSEMSNQHPTVSAVGCVLFALWFADKTILQTVRKYQIRKKVMALKSKKRLALIDDINKAGMSHVQGHLSAEDRAIIMMSAAELADKIKSGSLSSSVVLSAFVRQSIRSQAEFNCLTETFYAEAMQHAKAIDSKFAESKELAGLLHGLPISLKDSIGVKGVDFTIGLSKHVNSPAAADALIVKLLRDQGGIPYVKTNVPQTMISYECVNALYGRTTNPWNINYTPGGSSGGESALLANRGSVLGVGTDIGGSVRIPAHFSGNVALKPTAKRVSMVGFRPSVPGQEAIPAAVGPMANTVDDCELLMRVLCSSEAWKFDHELVPLPWDHKEYKKEGKLRVGYYDYDGFLRCCPAVTRAVKEAVDALTKQGHHCVPFSPPNMGHGIALYYALLAADNGLTISSQLDGEVWEDYIVSMLSSLRMPALLKKMVVFLLEKVLKEEKAAKLVSMLQQRTVAETWKLHAERKKFRQDFFTAWNAPGHEFDVVVCPVTPLPAVPHGTFKDLSFGACYTLVYNLLDLPAGVVPVSRVLPTDVYTTAPEGLLEKKVRKYYDADRCQGLPLGVQVVGLPFQDEKVMRAMRELSSALPFTDLPPSRSLSATNTEKFTVPMEF